MPLQLIALYCWVCACYDTHPDLKFQRLSPNDEPGFTDQELVTIYLFGHMQGHPLKRRIHDRAADRYVRQHWAEWFPRLPSYQAFSHRLNGLTLAFQTLIGQCLPQADDPDGDLVRLVDALPVMLSRGPHSPRARVARPKADLGYCAAKNQFYHALNRTADAAARVGVPPPGSAAHAGVVVFHPGFLPRPDGSPRALAPASKLGLLRRQGLRQPGAAPTGSGPRCPVADALSRPQADAVARRGGPVAAAARSRFVSALRLPVESLFKWLMGQTGFQDAANVRSEAGLDLHCYGKRAVACFLLATNP